MKKLIIWIAVIFVLVIIVMIGWLLYNNWQISLSTIPPKIPADLQVNAISATETQVKWKDTSNNELGFILFRDGVEIVKLLKNTEEYRDNGLKPSTLYTYQVQSYNEAGKSGKIEMSGKTKNPPIAVKLEMVGVYDNGEDFLREFDIKDLLPTYTGFGEIYVGIIVTDGIKTKQYHLPGSGDYYRLRENETQEVNINLFETSEIGEYLGIAVVAYEKDGGGVESLLYQALGTVVKSYIGPVPSAIFSVSGISFSDIIGDLCGADDDNLGSFQKYWTNQTNWGVGKYNNVTCTGENNKPGFRFSISIESPLINAN